MAYFLRASAVALALLGAAILTWVGITLTWGEPFTALETEQAQAALRRELADETVREAGTVRRPSAAQRQIDTMRQAHAFDAHLRPGQPFGLIIVPRLGLRMVIVEGTSAGDLARGGKHTFTLGRCREHARSAFSIAAGYWSGATADSSAAVAGRACRDPGRGGYFAPLSTTSKGRRWTNGR